MVSIVREAELLSIQGLCFFRTEKMHIGSNVVLEGNLQHFIDFCLQNEVKTVFYEYNYYDKMHYTVTDDFLQEHIESEAEMSLYKRWAEQYNNHADTFDFSNPRGLSLCVAFGSFAVVCNISNDWMEFETAEEALATFQDEHEEELFDLYEYEEGPSPLEELKDILLADKSFRYCTNKDSRSNYMEHFMNKSENKRFWILVKGAKDKWDRRYQIDTIVHQIYSEYRNQCYKLKIQVGEELPAER